MPFTKFANLDFDQIKSSIKDYLRANSTFTDFDFEGSNFSVLIDTLAYNTYITAFNSNLVVNESFLDSATVRENVVSLARNIGYVPSSRSSAVGIVSFTASTSESTSTMTLEAGLVCTGSVENSSYVFSTPDNVSATVKDGKAVFNNLEIYEGTLLKKKFTVDGSLDQKFVLENPFIDTSTIRVYVKNPSDSGLGNAYSLVENIFNINKDSEIYLIQEVDDEKYELLFGDGLFGKKLEDQAIITVTYMITDGKDGNGASSFTFAGSFTDDNEAPLPATVGSVLTLQPSQNGSDIESITSIKNFAPRLYASQYRAVTANDYETIIKSKIYPNAESISVVGGEELSPPQFGKVFISVKPKNGTYVSDFNKEQIKNKLKLYSVSGIDPQIVDLKILYVEVNSAIYYDFSKINSVEDLKTRVINSLNFYSGTTELNSFGGRFKYSKVQQVIDNTDAAITSNITTVRIRRDLKAFINQQTQYEICYGNRFHVNPAGKNIKSTGFKIAGETSTVYITDTPNADLKTGSLALVKETVADVGGSQQTVTTVVVKDAGTVDYVLGEININTVTITSTDQPMDIIEIQAFPESNDVIGLKDLYLSFNIDKSEINMVKDVIASGDDISGVVFSTNEYYRSSYSNGELKRL
tara:strand:+ start:2519 stop:4435 length:1917 start_codon:yes stop_codon:yes gene_type:complete